MKIDSRTLILKTLEEAGMPISRRVINFLIFCKHDRDFTFKRSGEEGSVEALEINTCLGSLIFSKEVNYDYSKCLYSAKKIKKNAKFNMSDQEVITRLYQDYKLSDYKIGDWIIIKK